MHLSIASTTKIPTTASPNRQTNRQTPNKGTLRYTAYLYDIQPHNHSHHPPLQPHCKTDLAYPHSINNRTYYLLEGESFGEVILGGGSGADLYTVEQPIEHTLEQQISTRTVIRKLMPLPAGKKQNEEAKCEARAAGFHPPTEETLNKLQQNDQKTWFITQHLNKRSFEVSQLVSDTRAPILSRGALYYHGSDTHAAHSNSQGVAAFHDAVLLKGQEFGKVISNNNAPISEQAMNALANIQVDLLHRYHEHQHKIYWQATRDVEDPYTVTTEFFYNPTLKGLIEPLSRGDCQGIDIEGHSLHQLLTQEIITLNGTAYPNPLFNHQIIDDFKRYRVAEQTVQVHGDLQQTNQFLVDRLNDAFSLDSLTDLNGASLTERYRLVGLDHRSMRALTPSYAEIAKALWGPTFVPGMEDMWDAQLTSTATTHLTIRLTPKEGCEQTIQNFQQFDRALNQRIEKSPRIQTFFSNDPDAKPLIALAKANQYLRDLRIIIPRLQAAIDSGRLGEREKMSRRILFDIGQAAHFYHQYRLKFSPFSNLIVR